MELDQRAVLWLEHLKTWQQSGATQDVYCKTNGIHPKTFSNWKRRLRGHLTGLPKLTRSRSVPPNPVAPLVAVSLFDEPPAAKPAAQPAKQLELDISPSPTHLATKSSGVNLSIGKYQISIAPDFDPATLRRLLTVLGEAR